MSASQDVQFHEGQARQACLSCRRKRRWCDRTLPRCLACSKARGPCEGYASDIVRTFVNVDASNVSRRKRKLLCEALANAKGISGTDNHASHAVDEPQIRADPLPHRGQFDGLDMNSLQVDFRQHVEALWGIFCDGYCKTEDYWPPGCSLLFLTLRNRTLDLALVALSAQRLALDSPTSSLRSMSLTAYNKSIGLYRRLLQKQLDSGLNAMLAVISTVYALMEASLMQANDIANFGWGPSGHLDGAFALMQKCGPRPFAVEGLHLVFKKIREMGLYLALARHDITFLTKEEWITHPWRLKPKTWRDRLHDIALEYSGITANLHMNSHSSIPPEEARGVVQKILAIEMELSVWRSGWLDSPHPHLRVSCDCQMPAPLSCICASRALESASVDFALLQIECWAVQLAISTTLTKLLALEANIPASWTECLPIRSSHIAGHMEEALSDRASVRSNPKSSGIAEDICRTILPTWVLNDYKQSILTNYHRMTEQ